MTDVTLVCMQTVPKFYQTFKPSHYQLSLALDRPNRSFSGHVSIKGVNSDDLSIYLHSKGLAVDNVTVDGIPAVVRDLKNDGLEITASGLQKQEVVVALRFSGKITDAMHGVYPCYYEVGGVKKELLATQFESHHAREVFPCVDEPEAKALFDVTLITENGVTVLGNMPIASQDQKSDRMTTTFKTSPKMSPYLLAFVVGELQSKTSKTSNGTDVTIYATHAQPASSLDFGLTTAVKSIEFFNDYFKIPYPLPKCDHVALPDFSSGAMENWGLVTYREIALLADSHTAISSKEMIASVIAHETSHQWFGNLVTMKWWDDLWLNESFATLMEYVAVDSIYPEWNIWMTFASHETLSALRRDYLAGVQSVKTDVHHPDEISSLFDPAIVYAKGARLLKMLHSYIGEDAFRSGLTIYFNQHAYGNTKGSDLWKAFSDVIGEDIGEFMMAWLEQPGYPLVTVNSTTDGYEVSQQRFVLEDSSDSSIWPIPLGHKRADLPKLLSTPHTEVTAKHGDIRLNQGNSGHFVTTYSPDLLQTILGSLYDGKVSTIDRLALLHETSLLARAGVSSASELFELLLTYREENEEPVWDIMSLVIADLKRFVETNPKAENLLKKHIIALVESHYNRLGWKKRESESESNTKLRATILGLLTYCEYPPVIEKGLELFRQTSDLSTLDGELRGIICSIAGKCGDEQDFEKLFVLYKTSQIAELQQDALGGLTSTKDSTRITRLIRSITNETIVRTQDVDRWFIYLMRNRYARELAWEWMVGHWRWIEEKFDSDKSYDSFPRYAASCISTYEWKDKYNTFFAPLSSQPALSRSIELGSKDISARAAWIKRDQHDLFESFRQ